MKIPIVKMREEIKIKIIDKWIVVSCKFSKGKTARFRRSSNNGILLESLKNNPKGVSDDILVDAFINKIPVPPLD